MADIKEPKISLSLDAFDALIATLDLDALPEEQKQALLATQEQAKLAKEAKRVKALLSGFNEQLLVNAKELLDRFSGIAIPDSVQIIKIPYNYDKESSTFVVAGSGDKNDKPVITSTFAAVGSGLTELVTILDEVDESANFKSKVKSLITTIGLKSFDRDNLYTDLEQKSKWLSGNYQSIATEFTGQSINELLNEIDADAVNEVTDKGSVVLTYNGASVSDDSEASWSVTTASFGKSTKYKSTGNGKRTSASEWVPPSSSAKNNQEYLLEIGADDTNLQEIIAKHTTNGVMNWKAVNAPSHIVRIEKELPEAERYYTNYKKSQ